MILDFEKWHGCKNDFILIWTHDSQEAALIPALQKVAPILCSRDGSGIGADGILLLTKHGAQDLVPHRMTIVNADGTLASHCGNGVRCAAAAASKREVEFGRGIEPSLQLSFEVGSKEVISYLRQPWNSQPVFVAAGMGYAKLDSENTWFSALQQLNIKKELSQLNVQLVAGVNLGNNHIVVQTAEQLETKDVLAFCQKVQKNEAWDGINIHFCWEIAPSQAMLKQAKWALRNEASLFLQAISFERGVGFTQACGSGACAISAMMISQGFCENGVMVKMPGGDLYVTAEDAKSLITLHGPCEYVFAGKVEI